MTVPLERDNLSIYVTEAHGM